jgi:hypothetical protein
MTGNWRKSSFSFSNGGCIEAADWRTSSASMADGNCVEVASGVAVRDTQDREGPVLKFSAAAWRAFTAGLSPDEKLARDEDGIRCRKCRPAYGTIVALLWCRCVARCGANGCEGADLTAAVP